MGAGPHSDRSYSTPICKVTYRANYMGIHLCIMVAKYSSIINKLKGHSVLQDLLSR